MPDLEPLFSPDSVAIIGASADTHTLRGRLTRALIGHGYDGRVYPVTRSQAEVLGLKAYPGAAALPEPADLAVILVPAAHVVETLAQCGERGIRAAVVISSGFGEESNEAAAQGLGVAGGADDGDAVGRQQRLQVGHRLSATRGRGR